MYQKILSKILEFLKDRELRVLIAFAVVYRIFLFTVIYYKAIIAPDSTTFYELAKRIAFLNLSDYDGKRSLGYPILILFGLGNKSLIVFYQHLLGILTSVFQYKILRNFNFSAKHGLWMAMFLTGFLNVFFYESSILVETLVLFFITIMVYLLTEGYLENRSLKIEILMGSVLGILALIKPFYAFLPFVIFGFSIIKDFRFKNVFSSKLLIFIFSLTAYFGWSYVNKLNTGYFVSTTFFGLNMSQNCVYFAEKCPEEYKWIGIPYAKERELSIKNNEDIAMTIWRTYESGAYNNRYSEFPDLTNQLGKFAVSTIKNNPKDYIFQVVTHSWFDYWKPSIYYHDEDFNFKISRTVFDVIWYIQQGIFYFFKFGFVLLIPVEFFKFFRFRKITFELVIVTLVFTASVLQGIVTYGTNSQYSFPFEFLMIIVVFLFLKKEIKLPRRLNTFLQ